MDAVPELEVAWVDAQGPLHGYINFRQFVSWTKEFLELDFPLGLDGGGKTRPCRFGVLSKGGSRCSCPAFQAAAGSSALCECGHKASLHRSDFAQRTFTQFIEEGSIVSHWTSGVEGLVRVEDSDVLDHLQEMLDASHKPAPDNWTRDRGCSIHAVNGCSASCASRNRVAVPSGYRLMSAYRNQNQDLWQKYSLVRTAIAEEVARDCDVPHELRTVVTSGRNLEGELDESVNEWHLFHGTSPSKCKSICASNFRLALAGKGATWKDPGKDFGIPLYGYGVYLAERITKADEYSEKLPPEGLDADPVISAEADQELFTVLLCRVLGGRTNVVTTNEIEVDKLRKDVFEGSYNSVFGDRVISLGKPYREVVVYDKDQVYPEFLLAYTRCYD